MARASLAMPPPSEPADATEVSAWEGLRRVCDNCNTLAAGSAAAWRKAEGAYVEARYSGSRTVAVQSR